MEPLLERDAELAELEDAIGAVAAGRSAVVLIAGVAGTGKTSLVRALAARAAGRASVHIGRSEPLPVPVPLQPLREIAEEIGLGDLPEPARDRLALARVLVGAMARRAPALVVVEDAHWADGTTLEVLRLMARRLEDRPMGLVVTYRDDEVGASPDLAQLLGALATDPRVRRLSLRPLSEAAVRGLAEPAGLDAARLSRMTGGNPFLVVESIRAGDGVPPSVRQAVLARVGRLAPEARAVVEAVAVLGGGARLAVVEEMSPGCSAALEEALARGVLVARGDAVDFPHELTRDAIAATLPLPRRAELHARALAALARAARPGDAARLAHHAAQAGLSEEAYRHACRAADAAERVGALREVSALTRQALSSGAPMSPGDRFALLLRHARAANFAGARAEEAVAPAEEALALATQMGDRLREGRALVTLAWALWSVDRLAEARAAAARGAELLGREDAPQDLARAHAARARMEATAFDPGEAVRAGALALALAGRCGLEEVRIDVAVSVALARGHCGEEGALDALERESGAARAAGLAIQTVRTYVNRVFVAMLLRRHPVVDDTAREALALFEEYGTPIPAAAVETFRARSLLDRGRWDEAVGLAARGARNRAGEEPVARMVAGMVAARRGAPGSDAELAEAWAGIGALPESSRHAALRVARIEAAWLAGDDALARALAREARASGVVARFARPAAEASLWAHRLGVAGGPPVDPPEPIARELAGDWRGAVRAWTRAGAPYEAALAALPGDAAAAREALGELGRMGAEAAARAFARTREATGARRVRGPRRSTLANPAGLTRREHEVLVRLAAGETNAAIAAGLHLSPRTVAHHVAAVLAKLGAPDRRRAVDVARARGVLPQDGPPQVPT